MIQVDIDYDLSGHAYDVDNPTKQAEELCYKLNRILDGLKDAGATIRQIESQDVTDAEGFLSGLYSEALAPSEEPPGFETPSNTSMLLDEAMYRAIQQAREKWLATSNSGEKVSLEAIVEALHDMLLREETIYLSDGTPIYRSSGIVNG